MTNDKMNYTDGLKSIIYEDFLRSIASVRAGTSPDIAFREHEARVCRLRMKVSAVEMRHAEKSNVIAMVDWTAAASPKQRYQAV